MINGAIVQMVSVICPSRMKGLGLFVLDDSYSMGAGSSYPGCKASGL